MKYNEGMIDAVESMREDIVKIESMMDTHDLGDTLNNDEEAMIIRNIAQIEYTIRRLKIHAKLEG